MEKYTTINLEGLDKVQTDIINAVINEGVMRESERIEDKIREMRLDALLAGNSAKAKLLDEIAQDLGYLL